MLINNVSTCFPRFSQPSASDAWTKYLVAEQSMTATSRPETLIIQRNMIASTKLALPLLRPTYKQAGISASRTSAALTGGNDETLLLLQVVTTIRNRAPCRAVDQSAILPNCRTARTWLGCIGRLSVHACLSHLPQRT